MTLKRADESAAGETPPGKDLNGWIRARYQPSFGSLSVVPEPSTIGLVVAAIATLGLARLRRARRHPAR